MYGIYKFGNYTYPRRIRCRSNLGHIFRGEKSASYGPKSTVLNGISTTEILQNLDEIKILIQSVRE